MLTTNQINQFAEFGAVTIDSPFTDEHITRATEAFDRLLPFVEPGEGEAPQHRVSSRDIFEQPLIDFIQHPALEQCAKEILGSEAVELFATAIIKSYPQPDAEFRFSEHVDIKYRLSDIDSRPRRMFCSCLVWLSDVTEKTAPLMYRPGSHRLIGEHMEQHLDYIDDPVNIAHLPDLPFADPEPLKVKKGQVSLLTTGMIHGASTNVGDHPRRVMFIPFSPKGTEVRANMKTAEQRYDYYRALRPLLRPERRHILPEDLT
jgi:hypothetical protein